MSKEEEVGSREPGVQSLESAMRVEFENLESENTQQRQSESGDQYLDAKSSASDFRRSTLLFAGAGSELAAVILAAAGTKVS
jgi:hypothetical protein